MMAATSSDRSELPTARRINVELFSCAGGMAAGFRRAGVTFDLAVDVSREHCDSYERNLGHRPVQLDVRDLLRMVRLGWRADIDLLVADPPCTPWSRAGDRQGTADERDMLEVTCALIGALRPRRYLIGNVPGLDDGPHLPIVRRLIGGLCTHGYCTADFVQLDAADYGVPQHRKRPWWFGHRDGACIRWPQPTHGDPAQLHTLTLPGIEPLRPWVTCRDALGHLSADEMGRPLKMKRRGRSSDQPARRTAPRSTTKKSPSRGRHTRTDRKGSVAAVLEWPWDRPATTICADPRLASPGHRPAEGIGAVLSLPDAIELTEIAGTLLQGFPPGWAFVGRTKRVRWSALGQAMPPGLAEAVARAVVRQDQSARGPTEAG